MLSRNNLRVLQPAAVLPAAAVMFSMLVTACVPTAATAEPETSPVIISEPEYLHPEILVTSDELETVTAGLPAGQREAILERPQVFLELIDQALNQPYEYTVLVDKSHGLEADFAPDDLVSLNEYPQLETTRNDLSLKKAIMPMLLALNEAARQDGIHLLYGSTYRSYNYQFNLFNRWVDQLGAEEAARVSARAGHSQHQLGTVVDFSPISQEFALTPDYQWLRENAHRFGFSLSYPAGMEEITGYNYESWHWRYIGRTGIQLQQEFFNNVQQHYLSYLHDNRDFFTSKRK